jgi:ribosome recycling factor
MLEKIKKAFKKDQLSEDELKRVIEKLNKVLDEEGVVMDIQVNHVPQINLKKKAK